MDAASLADLLREAEEHRSQFEETHFEQRRWNWYAHHLRAGKNSNSPAEAVADFYSGMVNVNAV